MDKEFLENVLKELRCDADFRLETGFVDLDEMLAGIKKGNIISVGGRPAMGKTSFLISIFVYFISDLYFFFGLACVCVCVCVHTRVPTHSAVSNSL